MPEKYENEPKHQHQYPPTEFPPYGRSVNRRNSFTSTTRADLISSTIRSRNTHRIPASLLDLSNEFALHSPSPEHSAQYSSTSTNHVKFRYQNIPQAPPPSSGVLSPNPIPPATGSPYVPDSPTSSKYPQAPTTKQSDQMATSSVQRQLSPTPSGPPDYSSTYSSQMESQIPFAITDNSTWRDSHINQYTSYQLPSASGSSLPSSQTEIAALSTSRESTGSLPFGYLPNDPNAYQSSSNPKRKSHERRRDSSLSPAGYSGLPNSSPSTSTANGTQQPPPSPSFNVIFSGSTGAGAEKSARSGVRGPKHELVSGGNEASGQLQLLAGGPTALTRITSAGSSGSTSSTISFSTPAPPLKDTDFTSFAALNNNSSTSNAINSHNDNSTAISGCVERMHASMPPRSPGYPWQGEDHTQPPRQRSHILPQIPSIGYTPTNLDNYSVKNTCIENAFYSQKYLRKDDGGALPDNIRQYNWPVLGLTQRTTTCWIGAEHALQHARNNISSVYKVFDKWEIPKSDYAVLAGFDESLVKSGVGYLEQIHVFTIAEVDPSSSLFTELGELFSPFSSILFTESSSYRLPVFKDDGSEWEFDKLIYLTVSKFADDGSGAKNPPAIISFSTQTPSSGFIQPESSSGSSGDLGEGEKNKKLDKGKKRDMGDKADKDKDSSDKPNDPPGDGDRIPAGQDSPPEIVIVVDSEIYHNQEQDKGPSQTLNMRGSLTIETKHENPQYFVRIVKFTGLNFGTTDLRTEKAYKQIHLRVSVDSREPKAYPVIEEITPNSTPGSAREERHSSSVKSGWTRVMTAMLNLGLNPQGGLSGSLTKTKESSEGSEKTRYTSPITQQDKDGKIWWDYGIGDDRYQEIGYPMPKDVLPTVHFRFYDKSPPKFMDIVITSYWSKIFPTRSEPDKTQIHKLLHLYRSTGKTQRISFSNIFQIVALTAEVDKLIKSNYFNPAKVKMNLDSGVSEPPDPEDQRREAKSLKGIEGTPVVVDADDLEKLKLENLPKTRNARFKLSDICDLNWVKDYKKEFQ